MKIIKKCWCWLATFFKNAGGERVNLPLLFISQGIFFFQMQIAIKLVHGQVVYSEVSQFHACDIIFSFIV